MSDLLVRSVLSVQLVFGLEWLPLISGRASRAAHRIARQYRATHVVLDGESPAAFGYGRLRVRLRGRSFHSAAQGMARLYPVGSVAIVLPIEGAGHWLVAVHEGAVMARTDIMYGTPEQAIEALRVLKQANPRLVVLEAGPGAPSLEAISGACDNGTLMRNTGYRRRVWLGRFCVLAAGAGALTYFTKPASLQGVEATGPYIDSAYIQSRWAEAVERVERGMGVHGVAATHTALRHIYDIPAVLAGWALVKVICHANGALWQCVADYERRQPAASNRTLMAQAPVSWQLDFPTMERAKATWTFQTGTLAPAQRKLQSISHNWRHVQSAWQGVRPAFSRITLGSPKPLAIEAPRDADGRPLVRPAGIPTYARRSVEFDGPLRSLSVLLPHTDSIAWRSFTLVLSDSARPGLTSSRLRVTLNGELYELYETDAASN